VAVERHRADGAVTVGHVGRQPAALPVGHQRGRIARRHTDRLREGVGALADQQHVLAVVQHAAGERDRVDDAADAGDGAAVEAIAFHERGVHLDGAGRRQHGAVAGVEAGVIFEHTHGGLDGVERAAVLGQHAPAGQHRRPHAGPQLVTALGGVGAGTTVHDERGHPGNAIARWRHGHHRVTIRPDCKTEARSTVSTLASSAAAAVRGSSPTARQRARRPLRAMPASATGRGRCRALVIRARGCC